MLVEVASAIVRSPRVMQIEGMFDLPAATESRLQWEATLPIEDRPWHIGLIVGPSGCGKSTVTRALFGRQMDRQIRLPDWDRARAIVDAFPEGMSIKEIVSLLSSVGFSSPPAWRRPFQFLSTGEQFRASLARLMAYAEHSPNWDRFFVVDEFTSVVDRTVARIASAALAKAVRRRQLRLVAVTCHEDVEEWLQPDWVYRPASNVFDWRRLRRRPAIVLEVRRVHRSAWQLFRTHHYLSHDLARSAVCFVAFWGEQAVAFSAWLQALTPARCKREHRTVTLPDFQGVGIGHRLADFCAALWKALGYRVRSTTAHPGYIAARQRSPNWQLVRSPSLVRFNPRDAHIRHAVTRLTSGFEYIGPPLDRGLAERLLAGA
ncbi:MAG: hypothetical protein KatS3mg105_4893 [Gemmatales bacterium]|nr:MAG: hypothetical protein KatS3mg105_4893 [Gemmatales bacterium]